MRGVGVGRRVIEQTVWVSRFGDPWALLEARDSSEQGPGFETVLVEGCGSGGGLVDD